MKIYGPKSLIKINGKHSIISRQLKIVRNKFEEHEIIVVCGDELNAVRKGISDTTNIKFVHNENATTTNVVYSIGLGLQQATTEKILIVYGDLIFEKCCLDLSFKQSTVVVTTRGMKTEEVGCICNNTKLENIFYQLPLKWAQISYFCGKELKYLKEISLDKRYSNWFGFEAINEIINRGGEFLVESPDGWAMDIDSSYDLKKYENFNKKQH